ncbi:CACTA en-spm transposon protein [Cucumis melo var. makuwa]|uniref:CACTA en-spm transposon protein n=1 Tax=Cucumis melo var. makuwa TaxID=1194695 RepID=A0A5A7VJV8_CUCMM|nr:CACTA en-spm transposon protein [Cucumis melo var. makuwa]
MKEKQNERTIPPTIKEKCCPVVTTVALAAMNSTFRAGGLRCSQWMNFDDDRPWHIKKYSGPKEARANPPHLLVRCDEDWHVLCDHYMNRAFQQHSRTNKAARQPSNHSSRSKSFLQRQHELAEQREESIDRVELFRKTHVRDGTFVSHAAEDVHIKLQSRPILGGSQPLSGDEICETLLGR